MCVPLPAPGAREGNNGVSGRPRCFPPPGLVALPPRRPAGEAAYATNRRAAREPEAPTTRSPQSGHLPQLFGCTRDNAQVGLGCGVHMRGRRRCRTTRFRNQRVKLA